TATKAAPAKRATTATKAAPAKRATTATKAAPAKRATTAGGGTKTRAASVKRGGGSREYMRDFARGREHLFCQSCGFNMRRDPAFGTGRGGALTDRYCSGCYRDGAFVEAVDTPEAFINAAVERIAAQRKQAIGKTRLDLKKELPRLARWQ
ncbi:MAG: hypothetical protein FJZ92_13090, partial [Chloroflexi bacterium]|nr:hypothetical protein [Chloroflexota bacterium]